VRFELVTAWSLRLWYHIKQSSQSKNLKLLNEILRYNLYYSLTLKTPQYITPRSHTSTKSQPERHLYICVCVWTLTSTVLSFDAKLQPTNRNVYPSHISFSNHQEASVTSKEIFYLSSDLAEYYWSLYQQLSLAS
jgi:hypothetical protein